MVQAYSVLVELVGGDRPQPDQAVVEGVQHAVVQKAQLFSGRVVGAGRHLECHRPAEDGLVESPGPPDVGDRKSDVRH
jgi:hypothetical protein